MKTLTKKKLAVKFQGGFACGTQLTDVCNGWFGCFCLKKQRARKNEFRRRPGTSRVTRARHERNVNDMTKAYGRF